MRFNFKYIFFFFYRNPNEVQETEHNARSERRLKNIDWTPYESSHKKYLNFGE